MPLPQGMNKEMWARNKRDEKIAEGWEIVTEIREGPPTLLSHCGPPLPHTALSPEGYRRLGTGFMFMQLIMRVTCCSLSEPKVPVDDRVPVVAVHSVTPSPGLRLRLMVCLQIYTRI